MSKHWDMSEKVSHVLAQLNPKDRALASAAPELLESLKLLVGVLEDNHMTTQDGAEQIYHDACMVIAKAEGRHHA